MRKYTLEISITNHPDCSEIEVEMSADILPDDLSLMIDKLPVALAAVLGRISGEYN